MSSIDKLSIMGIRSFDHRTRETIQIFSPLTLIVGHNGSGKTTIIECLKYATTGDLPPNARNGAFIHDPNICGEKEVYAQVKLSFNNTSGARMICTRSLQLSVKKTTRQQKTLDSNLVVIHNGERSSVSSRCAELDTLVPRSLGVSRAVLDNVIFCHQEDSFWPLSEPAALKKKFDEIFEALKYAKVLDQIKAVRKGQLTDIKLLENSLAHYRTDCDRAARIRTASADTSRRIDVLAKQIESVEEQLKAVSEEQEQLFQSNQDFEHTLATLGRLRGEVKTIEGAMDVIVSSGLQLVDPSVLLAKLEGEKEAFAQKAELKRGQNLVLRRSIDKTLGRIQDTRGELSSAQAELGRAQATQDSYNAHTKQLLQMVRTALNEPRCSAADGLARLRTEEANAHKELEETKAENDRGMFRAQDDIRAASHELSVLEQRKTSNRAKIRNFVDQRRQLELKISHIGASSAASRLPLLRAEIESMEKLLSESRDFLNKGAYDQKVREKQALLSGIERELEMLNANLSAFSKDRELTSRISIEESSCEAAKKDLDQIRFSIANKWSRVTQLVTSEKELGSSWKQQQSSAEQLLEICESSLMSTSQKVENVRNDLAKCVVYESQSNEQLVKLGSDSTKWETEILEVCDSIEEFPGIQDSLDDRLKALESHMHTLNFAKQWFVQALENSKIQSCCSLCQRSFDSSSTKDSFASLMHEQIEKVKEKGASLDAEITSIQADIQTAKDVDPAYKALIKLRDNKEIESLRVRLHDLAEKKTELELQLKSLEAENGSISSCIQILHTIVDDIKSGSEKEALIQASKVRLESAKNELALFGDYTNPEELHSAIQSCNSRAKELKTDIERLIAARDSARADIQVKDNRRRDALLEVLELQNSANELQHLETQAKELESSEKLVIEEIESIEQDVLNAQKSVNEKRANFETQQAALSAKVEQASKSYIRIQQALARTESLQRDIDEFENSDGRKRLYDCEQRVKSLEQECEDLEQQVERDNERLTSTEAELNNWSAMERDLADNIRYRRLADDREQKLEMIRSIDEQQALSNREQFQASAQGLRDKYGLYNARKAGFLGELKQLDDQLRNYQKELEGEYKDVDEVYRVHVIKLRASEKANEDLAKYGKALDSAIMKYHSSKMDEVNRIMDELWKETYCGTDVDSILIRSDSEGAKGNRSYNYRVCMVKGNAELDMRGRCSAGQKVLASIIIRLALAECFSVQCGILCLDEPTTNLDVENIESLAKSLAKIVENRRRQANFQLVVITHDENFIRLMNCPEYCDFFYRVSRNEEQKSIIEQFPVADVL